MSTLTSPRLAGLREWQGKTYPAQWPAILDADTHERLVRLFADPSRRAHVVGRKRHLLSGSPGAASAAARCTTGAHAERPRDYRCVAGPAARVRRDLGQRGAAGGVRDRRGARRAGIPARAGGACAPGRTTDAPRRAELLEEIRRAQDKRAEARRDWADDVIDKEDWLDIRQRTEERITRARKEYDRLDRVGHRARRHPPLRHGSRRVGGLEHRPQARGGQGSLNPVTVHPNEGAQAARTGLRK